MSNVFAIGGSVSTPLMLAGFLVAAFFLILRQILKKGIFPSLTTNLSAEILKLIIERLFTLAMMALVLGFLGFALTIFVRSSNGVPDKTNRGSSEQTLSIVRELVDEFRRALEKSGVADFSRAEEAIASLRKIDDNNGHAWYFAGEIKRIKNSARFAVNSCFKRLPSEEPVNWNTYRQDFYRYVHIEKTLPASETGGDCGRPKGYCVQRTAWIHHLLANDFYEEALATADPREREAKLKRAKGHATAACRYVSPEGREGFEQCMDTIALQGKIDEMLEALVPQASKTPQKKVEATTPKKPTIDTMLKLEGDKSSFVRDVTIADGTKILVGKKFTKIWEIRNVGSVVWVNRFLERQGLGEGPGLLKSPSRVPIPYTLPGQRCRIEIQLIAPQLPGSSYAEWKMVDTKGTILFPDQKPVYVSVDVVQKL